MMVVEFTTVTPLIVKPAAPLATLTVVPAVVKLEPVKTTGTLRPRSLDAGEIEVRVGTGGLTTEKFTVLLVPFGVVTLTVRVATAVTGLIVKVAVTVVALTTVKLLTVKPPPPLTVIAVAPVKLVPVRVTATLLP